LSFLRRQESLKRPAAKISRLLVSIGKPIRML